MSDEELTSYEELYVRYFNPPDVRMDRKFYMDWLVQSKQNNSPTHFENYIINSKAYNRKVAADFHTGFIALVDERSYSEEVFNEFMTHFRKSVSNAERGLYRHIVTKDDIANFTRQHPLFVQKYSDIITRLYKLIHKVEITSELLSAYVSKFQTDPSYGIDELNNDVLLKRVDNTVEEVSSSDDLLKYMKQQWVKYHSVEPSDQNINEILETVSDVRRTIDTLIYNYNVFKNQKINGLTEAFLQVYSREISVYEFLKFIPVHISTVSHEAPETMKVWLSTEHQKHITNLKIVQTIYKKYLAETISEIDYIKRYNYTVDLPNFQDIIIDELVESSGYNLKMRESIEKIYLDLFNVEIAPEDEEYIFQSIKADKFDLYDSAVGTTITRLKEETERFYTEMNGIFETILRREPDEIERKTYKKKYRDEQNMQQTSESIRETLYCSLEYHEILKDNIKSIYLEYTGKSILPSMLYQVLAKVLSNSETMRDISKLRAVITSLA
jgi:hypothetical protein